MILLFNYFGGSAKHTSESATQSLMGHDGLLEPRKDVGSRSCEAKSQCEMKMRGKMSDLKAGS